MSKPKPLTLGQLVAIFVRTGCLAFGGGAATLAMLYDEFCVRRAVVTEEEFQLLFGLALGKVLNPAWIVLGGGAIGACLFRWAAEPAG